MARKFLTQKSKTVPFQVGDKVFSFKEGHGIVERINDSSYPVEVHFKESGYTTFSLDGKEYKSSQQRELYHLAELPKTSVRNVKREKGRIVPVLSPEEKRARNLRNFRRRSGW